MKHVVMFSGGTGSWATAKRVAEEHGTDNLILLFADTLMEDEDLYRFLDEAHKDVGGELVRISTGLNPWEVFYKRRFLGNSRLDPCSEFLKRIPLRKWLTENCDPAETTVYIGIDWTEEHRYIKAQKYWAPWNCLAPLIEPPLMDKPTQLRALEAAGIKQPRLYTMGFSHNNCGGFCVKAGQGHFRILMKHLPERYKFHEEQEQKFREFIGKDVAILRKTKGPHKGDPLTLRELRVMEERQVDMFDLGGCGCVTPPDDEEVAKAIQEMDAACSLPEEAA
jgi:hypothetical protein